MAKAKPQAKELLAANFHRQDTCANCAYGHPIEGDKVIQCGAFSSWPFVHQAYICDKYEPLEVPVEKEAA